MIEGIDVLIVEDSLGDVELIRQGFRQCDTAHRLHVASDGVEALLFLRAEKKYIGSPRPSLILLDINLPRKSGHEVLRELAEDEHLRLIPVVVLTTSNSEEDIRKAYQAKANAYVQKPLRVSDFLGAVQAIESFWVGVATRPSDA